MSVTEQPPEERTGRPDEIKAVPVRHPGRWVGAAVVLVIAASLIRSAVTNPNFQWSVVKQYLFDSRIITGAEHTLLMTVLAMIIGVTLGIVLAVMRQSPNPIVSGASWLYIWFFRGTPLLVQLIFWYAFASLYKQITIGVPFGGPALLSGDTNSIITLFMAALLGLGLNEGAYMAEIVRAGFLSVPEGQTEAAQSLGMSRIKIMRLVVLPQAMRVIIPPTGNETISMLKNTSLLSVITYVELTFAAEQIYAAQFNEVPLLIVISVWYLAMTSVLYVGQYFIERHYGRGFSRAQRATMKERWLGFGHGGGANP